MNAITPAENHVDITIRLTPNGGRDELAGIREDAAGSAYLTARVTAVAEKGKANKALIALVAKRLGIAKSSISIISGETARMKKLRIAGDPEFLMEALNRATP
ncbi:DUF167 domain-containing protein [Martelella alba]|uniref:UPF0235 protein FJU08_09320 n=1 Tax=Martelella alba TaxID=2590451 RepID=A0A506UGH1_9HYPH|nr:DUF167 domain-containing protein [Martelella alba]